MPCLVHHLKKQNDLKKKKKVLAHSLYFLHAIHFCFLYFLHTEPPPLPHRLSEQNDFEEVRVLAVPFASSSGVVKWVNFLCEWKLWNGSVCGVGEILKALCNCVGVVSPCVLWMCMGDVMDRAIHGLGGQWPPLIFFKII